MGTDYFDDMTEAEFDSAFAAGEPAEIVRVHRIRVQGGGRAVTSPAVHTWAAGRPDSDQHDSVMQPGGVHPCERMRIQLFLSDTAQADPTGKVHALGLEWRVEIDTAPNPGLRPLIG